MNTETPDLLAQHLPVVLKSWEGLLVDAEIKAGRMLALHKLAYTWALLADISLTGYEDRWCYPDYRSAKAALDAWSGEEGTEPTGWHRHPDSGRRRDPDGREYVMP